MNDDKDDALSIIEDDYRQKHMYWIEKRLNRRLEKWFRNTICVDIKDLLADGQVNDLQIEIYGFYSKLDYQPINRLSPQAYEAWINRIITGWAIRKSVSVWSKIKLASQLHEA